jgi:hypothetical protein
MGVGLPTEGAGGNFVKSNRRRQMLPRNRSPWRLPMASLSGRPGRPLFEAPDVG